MDSVTISTAYAKMKNLYNNIRNEIQADIKFHNQDILPRKNNSRFGALEDLDEEAEEETHNEEPLFERPDGPTGAILSGKGKRAQLQVLEAQIANDKLGQQKKANNSKGSTSYKEKGPSTVERSRRSSKQLAEIESDTMDPPDIEMEEGSTSLNRDSANDMVGDDCPSSSATVAAVA
nr:Epidermin biosynthesis protein like [Ipomoea batatas]